MRLFTFLVTVIFLLTACQSVKNDHEPFPWEEHGKPITHEGGSLIIQHDDGTPFLWLGCTAWGMTE